MRNKAPSIIYEKESNKNNGTKMSMMLILKKMNNSSPKMLKTNHRNKKKRNQVDKLRLRKSLMENRLKLCLQNSFLSPQQWINIWKSLRNKETMSSIKKYFTCAINTSLQQESTISSRWRRKIYNKSWKTKKRKSLWRIGTKVWTRIAWEMMSLWTTRTMRRNKMKMIFFDL